MKQQALAQLGPNQAMDDRILEILNEPGARQWVESEWRTRRLEAYQNDYGDGAAVTCAQWKAKHGDLTAVHNRVNELLGTPVINNLHSELDWKEARSRAWTQNNLLEVAALSYCEHLLNYRPIRARA